MARDDQSWHQNWNQSRNAGRGERPRDEHERNRDPHRDPHLESRDRDEFDAGREGAPQRGWGTYSRDTNQGSDLGRARSQFGNTRDDNYGGGMSGGFGGYGGSSGYVGESQYGNDQYGNGQSWRQSGNMSGDMSNAQNHVGRGPKGWKRSDDRIREDVNEQLERHREIDASDLEVRVDDGEVILTGHVSDRRMKRLAEDVVESISGVREVQNQIRVKREGGAFFGHTTGDAAETSTAPASKDDR